MLSCSGCLEGLLPLPAFLCLSVLWLLGRTHAPVGTGQPPLLSPLALLRVPSSGRCCASICVSALLTGAGPACGASLPFTPRPGAPAVSPERLALRRWRCSVVSCFFMSAPRRLLVLCSQMPVGRPASSFSLPASLSSSLSRLGASAAPPFPAPFLGDPVPAVGVPLLGRGLGSAPH